MTSKALGNVFKIRDIVSVKEPAYGAKLNGTTDDGTAYQAAIDDLKASTETVPLGETRHLWHPHGTAIINAPLNLYSGVKIVGTGPSSKIEQGPTFAGTALVLLKGQGANAYNQFSGLLNMGLKATGAVWCIKDSAAACVWDEFRNLFLDCGFGIDFNNYAQACVIDGVYGHGSIDQLLHLKGNHNIIRNIDKEGGTGSSTDPYILIENHSASNSNGNTLEMILLEQTTSANKSLIKLLNCDNTTLGQVWLEPTLTDGYGIRIQGCANTRIKSIPSGIGSTTKIKVDTSQNTRIDVLDLDGQDSAGELATLLEVDATSDVHIGELRCRRWQDEMQLASFDRNISIDKIYVRSIFTDGTAGYSPMQRTEWLAGQNLAVNGSFESGRYGWSFNVNPTTTEEYITSEVGAGLMGHFVWAASSTYTITQNITVPANMPVTVTAKVKMTGGTGWVGPYTNGVGITNTNGYHRANTGQGWQIISRTVIPNAAGSLTVGLQFVNATEVYVDEFSVSVGTTGAPDQGKFGSINLGPSSGQKTITYAAAAPTTGTAKQGDFVWNTAPSIDASNMILLGWSCTAAGSPGTWSACYASNVTPAT